VKLASGENLGTGTWARDNFRLSFQEFRPGAGSKVYVVGADGSDPRQLPIPLQVVDYSVLSPDEKTIYVNWRGEREFDTDRLESERRRFESREVGGELWHSIRC